MNKQSIKCEHDLLVLIFLTLFSVLPNPAQAHDGHYLPMPGEPLFQEPPKKHLSPATNPPQEPLEETEHDAHFFSPFTVLTGASLWASYRSPIPAIATQQEPKSRTGRMYLFTSGLEISILRNALWDWSTGAFFSGGVTENDLLSTNNTASRVLGGWVGADIGTTVWISPPWNWNMRFGIGITIGAGVEALEEQIIPHIPTIPFVMVEISGFGLKVGYLIDTLLTPSSLEMGESVIITLSHRFSLAHSHE